MDVFIDESGITGNHLLDEQQPFVVYTAINGSKNELDQQVQELRSKYDLKGLELKAANLLKRPKGRDAILNLFKNNQNRITFFACDKRFALACKFFEYIFEPVISASSSIFYDAEFHLFIANFLYFVFTAAELPAEQIFANFEKAMISKASADLDVLIPVHETKLERISEPIGLIRTFALCHQEKIKREISSLKDHSCGRWILDLSLTSVHHILRRLSERFGTIRLYCDRSNPLQDHSEDFKLFIGREPDRMWFRGEMQTITFNLEKEVEFLDSKESSGIQIADLIAGSICWAFKNPGEPFSPKVRELCAETDCDGLLPDKSFLDLTQENSFVGSSILNELVQRTLHGQNLTDGMSQFIKVAHLLFPAWQKDCELRQR